jgi:hypothetical protein
MYLSRFAIQKWSRSGRWCTVYTLSYRGSAQLHLNNQGLRARQYNTVLAPLFAQYLFVASTA